MRLLTVGCRWMLCGALLAAVGCAQSRILGASDRGVQPPAADALPATPLQPKHPTVISGVESALSLSSPLGDVDGDGLDDFFVTVASNGGTSSPTESQNLFYGRPDFPDQLSIDDADAVFEGNLYQLEPLGDVNGDELADFTFRNTHAGGGFEIMFGSRTRFSGRYAAGSLAWHLPELTDQRVILLGVVRAGDVNCDGTDDVMVQARRRFVTEDELGFGGEAQVTYLVMGSPDLPSGSFEPSWATARFEPADEPLDDFAAIGATVLWAGDADGDGCDDLVQPADDHTQIFYGGPSKFEGRLSTSDADARLEAAGAILPIGGDVDGDGASDFSLMNYDEPTRTLSIVYGDRNRWSGQVKLESELTVEFGSADIFPLSISIGDIDSVGGPELILIVATPEEGAFESAVDLYAIPGAGGRRRGSYALGERDRLAVRGAEGWTIGDGPSLGVDLRVVGDVDGDGGSDLITNTLGAGQVPAVYLIPSTPRAPD